MFQIIKSQKRLLSLAKHNAIQDAFSLLFCHLFAISRNTSKLEQSVKLCEKSYRVLDKEEATIMYIAEVQLQQKGDLSDELWQFQDLLASWHKNGQILGRDFPSVIEKDGLCAFLLLPEQTSLEVTNNGFYVTSSLQRLTKAGLESPSVSILGKDLDSCNMCSCSACSFLILFTTFLSLEPSLRCGDCFDPIPLYKIPAGTAKSGEIQEQVLGWQNDYQACDTLQLHCATGERFGLREMGYFDSSLSKRGREICDVISQAMNTPTYYYLHRYYGKSAKQERVRKCPSCDGEWLLPETLHHKFDFKCDKCKLLSNLGFSCAQNR